jgi:hypothetical protein
VLSILDLFYYCPEMYGMHSDLVTKRERSRKSPESQNRAELDSKIPKIKRHSSRRIKKYTFRISEVAQVQLIISTTVNSRTSSEFPQTHIHPPRYHSNHTLCCLLQNHIPVPKPPFPSHSSQLPTVLKPIAFKSLRRSLPLFAFPHPHQPTILALISIPHSRTPMLSAHVNTNAKSRSPHLSHRERITPPMNRLSRTLALGFGVGRAWGSFDIFLRWKRWDLRCLVLASMFRITDVCGADTCVGPMYAYIHRTLFIDLIFQILISRDVDIQCTWNGAMVPNQTSLAWYPESYLTGPSVWKAGQRVCGKVHCHNSHVDCRAWLYVRNMAGKGPP